jgi:hypothetical protein
MKRHNSRQRGWLGTVGVLIALLIIAWLVKDALREYGLSAEAEKAAAKAAESGAPTGFQRSPTPAAVSATPPGGTPSFQAPIERARSVETTVNRAAEAQGRSIDNATR